GQKLKRVHLDRDLAALGTKDRSGGADDVTGIEVREFLELVLAQGLAGRHQLDPPLAVPQIGEHKASLQPLHHQPAGHRNRWSAFALAEEIACSLARMCGTETSRIRLHTGRAQALQLVTT